MKQNSENFLFPQCCSFSNTVTAARTISALGHLLDRKVSLGRLPAKLTWLRGRRLRRKRGAPFNLIIPAGLFFFPLSLSLSLDLLCVFSSLGMVRISESPNYLPPLSSASPSPCFLSVSHGAASTSIDTCREVRSLSTMETFSTRSLRVEASPPFSLMFPLRLCTYALSPPLPCSRNSLCVRWYQYVCLDVPLPWALCMLPGNARAQRVRVERESLHPLERMLEAIFLKSLFAVMR